MYSITVFTPTYNRAHTLPKLYNSLIKQEQGQRFEWLVIDDGSTDETESLVNRWKTENKIEIQYLKVENGGKPRAINRAVTLARSSFLFIVDSDDYLAPNSLAFMINACQEIADDDSFVGVGGLQGTGDYIAKKNPSFTHYVDATNLERPKHGLDVDCNEAYKVNILKKYPFMVWEGEIFTPESVVLNEMALDGYKLRWFNKVIVISEYLEDGMTKGSWKLMARNPMGYAMLFNHRLKYVNSFKERSYSVLQMVSHVALGGHWSYLFQSNDKLLTFLCLPLGIMLAIRRKIQYKRLNL